MAGNELIPGKKLPASSILETVVAMVIIVIVFSTAMVILANVMKRSVSLTAVRAEGLLRQQLLQEESAPRHQPVSFRAGDLEIKQEMIRQAELPGVLSIALSAYNGHGQKVAELNKLITTDEN